MKTILCVEDELEILEHNCRMLSENGYNILCAENLSQAREHMAAATPDMILLDIMLPDGNGLDYLKELRDSGNNIPVIMLTAWNRSYNKAHGLDLGADDYMGKPFEYDELLARIRKVLKQAERIEQVPEQVKRGSLTFEPLSSQAYLNGEDLMLTQKEFALLLLFAQSKDKIMSLEYLYNKVWNAELGADKRTLQRHVSSIRKKIENSGYTISSVYGNGYCFSEC